MVAVIYKSKYGSTKRYAELINNSLKGDLFDVKKVNVGELTYYNSIVVLGPVHAGKIAGFEKLKHSLEKLGEKEIAIVAVGLKKLDKAEKEELFKNNNVPNGKENIKAFYLRGAIDYPKMSFIDRMLFKFLKKQLEKKKDTFTESDKELYEDIMGTKDYVSADNIKPIVDFIL